jgi:hypothetical protein
MRRHRRRERRHEITVTVTLTQVETGVLLACNCLISANQLEDRAAIADAIHKLIGSVNLEGVTRHSR